MGPLLPIAGAVQWISGVLLAVVALGRTSRYGATGRGPRVFAWLSLLLFAAALAELLVYLLGGRALLGRWFGSDFLTGRWQLVTHLGVSAAAWLALLGAWLWNSILGVKLRRRAAAAELQRRTDRALSGIDREGHPREKPRVTVTPVRPMPRYEPPKKNG